MTLTALNSPELNRQCLPKLQAKYEEAGRLTGALHRNDQNFGGKPIYVAVGYWNEAVCQMISSCFGREGEEIAARFKEQYDDIMSQAMRGIKDLGTENFNRQLSVAVSVRAIQIEGLINRMENSIFVPGGQTPGGKTSEATGSVAGAMAPARCVILTAVPVELHAVCAHLASDGEVVHKGTVYERGVFTSGTGRWEVFAAELGAGNNSAAFELERAISRFDPAVVMFVGVAGGIKDVRVGDVVAATKVYGYESGKAEAIFKPRPDVGNSSYKLVQRARAVARRGDWAGRIIGHEADPSPQAVIGAIAAGEKVVASTESSVHAFLKANYGDALAVEMEGRGFLEAAHANPQVSTLIVRGISDMLDDKSEPADAGRQALASRHASAFAFEVLSEVADEFGTPTGGEA